MEATRYAIHNPDVDQNGCDSNDLADCALPFFDSPLWFCYSLGR
jgi:hypothetical protein